MTAVAEIQARINEIQTRIADLTKGDSGSAFADTLNLVLGAGDKTSIKSDTSAMFTGSAVGGGQSVVDSAKKYLGLPYIWGGTDRTKGLDCSGLLQVAFGDLGIQLPRVAADQARMGQPIASLAQAKPGDIVAFGSPVDHIGIYAGDNKMVVAPKRGDVVKVQEIYETPTAIRRVIPEGSATPFSAAGSLGGLGTGGLGSLASLPGTGGSSGISSSLSSQYNNLFTQAGAKHGISPNILAAVAKQESGFNANARSGAGAQGLMQIMPGTAKGLGVDALDPVQAVDGAARMLSGLVKKFGSVELALAGYNAGPNAVTKHGGIPPYAETQKYVRNVISMSRGG